MAVDQLQHVNIRCADVHRSRDFYEQMLGLSEGERPPFASVGYWLDREYAGRGIMPRAVAMVIDHCFFTAGLHRVEIAIRPENSNSLRVVEKLGLREVGYAPKFLHIDGAWRDHRIYAITKDEVPDGVLSRLRASGNAASNPEPQ